MSHRMVEAPQNEQERVVRWRSWISFIRAGCIPFFHNDASVLGPVVTRRMVIQPLLLVLEPAGHRPTTPVMPAARITRATRLRPTATPHATSSA